MSAPLGQVQEHGPKCVCLECQIYNHENDRWWGSFFSVLPDLARPIQVKDPITREELRSGIIKDAMDFADDAIRQAKDRGRL